MQVAAINSVRTKYHDIRFVSLQLIGKIPLQVLRHCFLQEMVQTYSWPQFCNL